MLFISLHIQQPKIDVTFYRILSVLILYCNRKSGYCLTTDAKFDIVNKTQKEEYENHFTCEFYLMKNLLNLYDFGIEICALNTTTIVVPKYASFFFENLRFT